jgi:hypothetical protein
MLNRVIPMLCQASNFSGVNVVRIGFQSVISAAVLKENRACAFAISWARSAVLLNSWEFRRQSKDYLSEFLSMAFALLRNVFPVPQAWPLTTDSFRRTLG